MIAKTEAVVLRVIPYSRTSHVVWWLTEREGRVTTLIKGACRPRSMFLGQYDLFYTCELLYYERNRNGLHIARECCPLKTRSSLRRRWRSCSCASYVCDILARITSTGGHEPGLYRLAEFALDFLADHDAGQPFLFWFELRLLRLLGLEPRLTHCSACARPMGEAASVRFSPVRGGTLCPLCTNRPAGPGDPRTIAGPQAHTGPVTLSPDVVAMLRNWQCSPSPRSAQNTLCRPDQLLILAEALRVFLLHHLDMMPASRDVALRMLGWGHQ